jgi:hypothetical protein
MAWERGVDGEQCFFTIDNFDMSSPFEKVSVPNGRDDFRVTGMTVGK